MLTKFGRQQAVVHGPRRPGVHPLQVHSTPRTSVWDHSRQEQQVEDMTCMGRQAMEGLRPRRGRQAPLQYNLRGSTRVSNGAGDTAINTHTPASRCVHYSSKRHRQLACHAHHNDYAAARPCQQRSMPSPHYSDPERFRRGSPPTAARSHPRVSTAPCRDVTSTFSCNTLLANAAWRITAAFPSDVALGVFVVSSWLIRR